MFTATTGPHGERGGDTDSGDDGVTVHRLAIPLPGGIPVNPFAPPEVRRRLAAGGFDVAHAHLGVVSPFATDLVPVALGRRAAGGGDLPLRHRPVAGVFRAMGHLARWARRGVALNAVSTMAATRVSGAARGAPVEVVPNGVDAAWWRPVTEHAEAGHPAPVHVVSAMRLVSRKRPVATLEVLRAGPRRCSTPRWRCARRSSARGRSDGSWSTTCAPAGWTGSSCPGGSTRTSCAGCTRAPTST